MRPRRRIDQLARAAYRRLPDRAQRRAAALRTRVRHRLQASPFARLSVVMPVYNVEGYLAEAVESVLSQSYRNLELILVDDGSTDSSGRMCDEFAREDPRVRVIHKQNGGLGAARNTGIAAARGKYLAFIDSDDYVLPGAYEAMIASLRLSGSDVVTGNVRRRQGKREYQAWNQSRSHLVNQSAISLRDNPELVFDTVAWNKVFVRKFFTTHVKSFPVGKLYEDIVPIFTAFMRARSIDVLARTVYIWRLRDEGDSITQRLLEPKNIGDRFEMIDTVEAMINDNNVGDVVADRLTLKILEGDLWIYVREMAGAGEETVGLIEGVVKHYWPKASDRAVALIPAERRISYWLLEQERVADVALFRQWYADVTPAPPLRRAEGRLLLDTSGCPAPLEQVPARVLDMGSAAEGVANVTSVRWTGPTTLTVTGYAYTKYVSSGSQGIALVASPSTSGDPVVLPTQRTTSVDSALWAGDTASPHDHDGFACTFDVQALRAGAMAAASEWSFAARVTDGEVVRTIPLRKIWKGGSGAVVGSAVLADGTLALVNTDRGRPLRLIFDASGVLASEFELTGTELTLRFGDRSAEIGTVRVAGGEELDRVAVTHDADGSFRARFPVPVDPEHLVSWRLLATVRGKRTPVLAPAGMRSSDAPNSAGLRAVVTRSGRAFVQGQKHTAIVTEIDCAPNGDIRLAGSLYALDDVEVGIAPGEGAPQSWHKATVRDGRFEVSVPPRRKDFTGQLRPLRTGRYRLCARRAGGAGEASLVVSDEAALGFPREYLAEPLKIKLERTGASLIAAEISAPVPTELLGRFAKQQLIKQYAATPRELEDAVFFCIDLGANAADSGLAIHRELQSRGTSLRLYWGVEDLSVPVPDGGIPVVKGSAGWFEKLNRSRYIVNNYGAIWGLSKDPGQRYLQTWHGTPLKFIGVSERRHNNARNSALDQIARESGEWDAFVSPSPYFSSLVPTEFLFNGTILETGYPRNDRLANVSAAERDSIRAALSLEPDEQVLLYAPTFREGQRHGWRAAMYEGLDVSRLLDDLGPSWRVLLRGHSFNARDDHADRSARQIVDVTQHHDVNDLYIASDVLVTDYSSVMFDYAVTGKPMAFFTPDLKRYVASRGVYFDLEQTAPGPLHTDVTQLAGALRDLDALAAEYEPKYAAFRQRFAPWDDGKATARVVDAFFG